MKVRIKAVAGRIARYAPNGAFIPTDRYVDVELTPYLRRLRDVHGDIVEEPVKAKAAPPPVAAPTPAPAAKTATTKGE